jgi:hypothetical protein
MKPKHYNIEIKKTKPMNKIKPIKPSLRKTFENVVAKFEAIES